jgi:hypothetical protein
MTGLNGMSGNLPAPRKSSQPARRFTPDMSRTPVQVPKQDPKELDAWQGNLIAGTGGTMMAAGGVAV